MFSSYFFPCCLTGGFDPDTAEPFSGVQLLLFGVHLCSKYMAKKRMVGIS